jgi:hypothetical protein
MSVLRKFVKVPGSDRQLLVISALLLAAIRLLLWVLPSRVILGYTRSLVTVPERAIAGRPTLQRIVWAIEAAAARIPHATCLTQALSAQLLMRRYGYGSRLCVGVARDARGAFRAHAWIERDGSILIGGEESRALMRLMLPTPEPSTASMP